ncbi:MAG TPA: DUF5658 family protein [Steroidobacteraceae bacterium]|nr:DUF5658 family protein [Steroidobacteraceae bacterium]
MDVKDPKSAEPGVTDRRRGERRSHVLRALVYGSFRPRRRGARRADERGLSAIDWHHPQWLAVGILIVVLSCSDALLTLMLMDRGAEEANPLMARLIGGSGLGFAVVKIGLTAAGVLLLTQLARLRAFGRIPVGTFLYVVLAIYATLVFYEVRLLSAPGP